MNAAGDNAHRATDERDCDVGLSVTLKRTHMSDALSESTEEVV